MLILIQEKMTTEMIEHIVKFIMRELFHQVKMVM